jgi:hypothetical protein
MARGGRKTPPPPNRTPIVTRSHSQDNIPPQTATTSTEDPQITVEPATPHPQAVTLKKFSDNILLNHTKPLLALGNLIARGSNL